MNIFNNIFIYIILLLFILVSSVCCSIEIDNKKVFTGIVPCIKNNDGTVTAHFNEAFVLYEIYMLYNILCYNISILLLFNYYFY